MTSPVISRNCAIQLSAGSCTKAFIVFGALGLYVLCFRLFFPSVGDVATAFMIGPIVAAAWLMGIRAGVLLNLLGIPLNVLLFHLEGKSGLATMSKLWPGIIASMILGVVTGWLSTLLKQAREQARELSREREILANEIHERRKAEKELAQIQRQQETILNNIPDIAWMKDREGKFVIVNEAFGKSCGTAPANLVGKTDMDAWPADLARQYMYDDVMVMDSGRRHCCEEPLADRDGNRRWIETIKMPLTDHHGNVVGTTGIARDITDRKCAEAELQKARDELELKVKARTLELLEVNRQLLAENQQREIAEVALRDENSFNRAIIDTVAEGLCVCHNCAEYPYVRFTVWNRRMTEITGYAMEEINRLGWYQTLYPDPEVQKKAIDRMERMREGDDLVREEWTVVTANGSHRVLEIYTSILKNHDEAVHVLGVMQDVTERKHDTEKLRRALSESKALQRELVDSHEKLRRLSDHLETVRENERRDMAREVHDELGQSLTGLRFDLAWLARRAAASPPELIPKIREMGRTVNASIKSVQRISAQLRPRVLDDLGLAAAVEWQVNEFRKRFGARCLLSIQEGMSEPSPRVATALFRILQEALTNVIRHARATKVTVSLSCDCGMIILEVVDNGRGLGDAELKSPTSYGIIGIRERAHLCGGMVKLKGEPGKGTSLAVYIPVEGLEER